MIPKRERTKCQDIVRGAVLLHPALRLREQPKIVHLLSEVRFGTEAKLSREHFIAHSLFFGLRRADKAYIIVSYAMAAKTIIKKEERVLDLSLFATF